VPHSTVAHWIATGLVEPARRGRGRRGHDLGVLGLLELIAVRDLRQAGIPLRAIRRAVANLRRVTGERRPLSHLVLLVLGNDVLVRDSSDGNWVSVLLHPTQRVMVFPIGDEHRRLVATLTVQDAPEAGLRA
jgi:DNA-binding transcriptional MerR regulator